jgi:hypothetical protein
VDGLAGGLVVGAAAMEEENDRLALGQEAQQDLGRVDGRVGGGLGGRRRLRGGRGLRGGGLGDRLGRGDGLGRGGLGGRLGGRS